MITGPLIVLRSWIAEDVPQIQKLKNDIDIQNQLMGIPRPNSSNKILNWLKQRDKDDSMVFFVIAKKQDNKAIGYIQISCLDKLNLNGYLGICLGQEFWGKGYANEALNLLNRYASSILNLRKIILLVKSDNSRAIAFYKKTGFREIGVLNEHQIINGSWCDVLMMERFTTR